MDMRAFPFTSVLLISLHVSSPHVSYPPWEPRTSLLSSTIKIILFCWALFPRTIMWALRAFLMQYIVPAPTTKETHPAPFAKELQPLIKQESTTFNHYLANSRNSLQEHN